MKKISLIIFLFSVLSSMQTAYAQSAVENKLADNVNVVPLNYSYENDYDTSKFRLKIYKMSEDQILSRLSAHPDNVCSTARSSKDIFLSSKNSAQYIVNVLKASESIDKADKDYKFNSAHYLWDFYLAFRDFVEINHPFSKSNINEVFDKLPNGTVILLSKHCVPNGAVALLCDKKVYTKRFPNLKNFLEKVDSNPDEKCKIGKGIKFIVEAKRFK